MRYTKLKLTWGPGIGDTLTFALDPMRIASPYSVQSISGLEPPDVVLAMSTKAEEGAVLQGRRANNRQIVILLGFRPEYSSGQSVGELRRKLYGMLTPKLSYNVIIQLTDDTGTDVLQTIGNVSKMDTNPFSKDPQTQITLDCLSPYFTGKTFVHPTPGSLSGGVTSFTVPNDGDAPAGFICNVTINDTQPLFRFFTWDESEWIHITYPFLAGDTIQINTIMGQREVTMTRSGNKVNMLQFLSPNTSWLQLDPGPNQFKPTPTNYTMNSWSSTARYWGI
jgi:hypothetical protein